MKPFAVLPLLLCLGLSACGGGGGGNGGGDDDRRSTDTTADTNRFGKPSDFVPFADAMVDDLIAATSGSLLGTSDYDLTGTWVFLRADVGTSQLMSGDTEEESVPLDTESYKDRQVMVFSVEDMGGYLVMSECGKAGRDSGDDKLFTYTLSDDGKAISMWDDYEAFAIKGTVENNRVLRFSNAYYGTSFLSRLDGRLIRFAFSTSITYIKISPQVDAVMGILNDAAHSDEPVLCASMDLYEWFEGMNPNRGQKLGYNSRAELTHYDPTLSVENMPTSEYEWLGRIGRNYQLQSEAGAGDLKLLVE